MKYLKYSLHTKFQLRVQVSTIKNQFINFLKSNKAFNFPLEE